MARLSQLPGWTAAEQGLQKHNGVEPSKSENWLHTNSILCSSWQASLHIPPRQRGSIGSREVFPTARPKGIPSFLFTLLHWDNNQQLGIRKRSSYFLGLKTSGWKKPLFIHKTYRTTLDNVPAESWLALQFVFTKENTPPVDNNKDKAESD